MRTEVGPYVTALTAHVRRETCQNTRQQRCSKHSPERLPAFMIDDVSEHKPGLMPKQESEHRVNPHKSPFRSFRVGMARSLEVM